MATFFNENFNLPFFSYSFFLTVSLYAGSFLIDYSSLKEKFFKICNLPKVYAEEGPPQTCSSPIGILLMTQSLCGWVPSASTSKRNWWLQGCSHCRVHLASATECFLHIWHVWMIPLPTVPYLLLFHNKSNWEEALLPIHILDSLVSDEGFLVLPLS